MLGEVRKGGEFQEILSNWGLVDGLVFENPGKVVGDEDGVEAGGERGIDVGAGAVTDHPSSAGLAGVACCEVAVGGRVLFCQNFDAGEERGETGAFKLGGLLVDSSLGDEEKAVAGGEGLKGFGDTGEQFDLLVGDGVDEADDAVVLLGGYGGVG